MVWIWDLSQKVSTNVKLISRNYSFQMGYLKNFEGTFFLTFWNWVHFVDVSLSGSGSEHLLLER